MSPGLRETQEVVTPPGSNTTVPSWSQTAEASATKLSRPSSRMFRQRARWLSGSGSTARTRPRGPTALEKK
jgi:hypothetical protein